MAQITVGDPHGLYKVFIGLVDQNGYNFGVVGEGAANGTLLSPYHLRYAKSATMPVPDRNVIDFTGGDVWTGSYVYGFSTMGSGTLESATIDGELMALTSGSAVDNATNSRMSMFAENISRPTPPQVWLLIVMRIQSKAVGSKGANKFLSIVVPRAWVAPKGVEGAPAQMQGGTYQYQVNLTMADRVPWGPLFTDLEMSLENDEAPMFYAITDHPLHAVGMPAASGATEVVTLPFKPITFDYSTPDSATDPLQVFVDGTITNATTVVQATGAVTVTQAFAGGEYIGIVYETDYEPTA